MKAKFQKEEDSKSSLFDVKKASAGSFPNGRNSLINVQNEMIS